MSFRQLEQMIDRGQTAYFSKNVSCSNDPLELIFPFSHSITCFGDENAKHRGRS